MPWQQVRAHQPEQCPHSTMTLPPRCCPQGAAHPPPWPPRAHFHQEQPPGMLQELGVPVPPACPCHRVPSTAARCFPPQGFISTTSAFWQRPRPAPQGTKTGQIMEKKCRKKVFWVVPALPQLGSLPLAALLFPRDDVGYHSRIHIRRGHRTNDLYLSPRLKITSHQYIHFYTHSFI